MPETDMISVGEPMPRLAAVEPANGPYSVSVTWLEGPRAGRTDIVDLARIIATYKVFKPLRDDRALFETVRLGEWGWSIVWEGNADLDIAADTLAELAAETMTNHDFVAFMKRLGWTLDITAAQLGISRRLVAYYAKNREIPRYIMLACKQLEPAPLSAASPVPAQALSEREVPDLSMFRTGGALAPIGPGAHPRRPGPPTAEEMGLAYLALTQAGFRPGIGDWTEKMMAEAEPKPYEPRRDKDTA